MVIQERKTYQAYYTKSTPIVDYMINMLCLKTSDSIFEPCGGDGVFIQSIIEKNPLALIDVCELNMDSIALLQNKFAPFSNIHIRHCDTLSDSDLLFNSGFGGMYDKIIANPPYGAWQDYDKRDDLKKIYSNLYIKETYALFLYRCIELLKEDGILSFIIPDTYLNLHMHKAIREHILTKTKIIELALFPSSYFPGVNFGYANLSIITLQKSYNKDECLDNEFKILSGFSNVEQLVSIHKSKLNVKTLKQNTVLSSPGSAFLLSDDFKVINAINSDKLKIGDIANCVTGFYSGDDKTFLQVSSADLKNGKNYRLVAPDLINRDYTNNENILDGIEDSKCFLPIVKGGNTKFLKPEGWFMNWSKEAVKHFKTDKKARFQNPKYYFKYGIGVPMISSSSITASLIDNKLFDQSIVGIFPKDIDFTYYLLAFFNSKTCNKLIRTINPSANNPANYIKKIPFAVPTNEQKIFITEITTDILNKIRQNGTYNTKLEERLNEKFVEIYGF